MFVKKTTQLSRAPGARVALELGGLAPRRELAVELLELEQHFAFAEVHEVVVGAERIHGRGRGGARRARRGGRAARVARPGSLKAAGPPSSHDLWLSFGLLEWPGPLARLRPGTAPKHPQDWGPWPWRVLEVARRVAARSWPSCGARARARFYPTRPEPEAALLAVFFLSAARCTPPRVEAPSGRRVGGVRLTRFGEAKTSAG